MAKAKSLYSCSACGAQSPKWAGQCSDCGAWNTLVETVVSVRSAGNRVSRFSGYAGQDAAGAVQSLKDIVPDDIKRIEVGVDEFDRVLGGGLVPGSVILIGGDPGIGKSTLLF